MPRDRRHDGQPVPLPETAGPAKANIGLTGTLVGARHSQSYESDAQTPCVIGFARDHA
jgi:hypothetical protein